MMTVPMDNSVPPARELAQQLFKKNIELENELRKSAQLKVPSDPNAWFQMRENNEAIILEDHDFSVKHEVECALWQLHYRRIEEFRAHINGVTSAGGSAASQGGKSLARSDRIKKIRSAFKSFLSEATGFYHDLILKIRAKYGLPLGYISEAPENQIILGDDEKRSAEMKKGLMSCHRCLIYLGDLARYKGLYGEGDSGCDFAAASSYYVQAASLWPSSGNPHHQLAILASYSGDDLVSVYRYFRSLAVSSPFSTARDNLIIAFEKNRLSYSQLPGNAKIPSTKTFPTRMSGRGRGRGRERGRGRGRGDARLLVKDTKTEPTPTKERDLSIPEILKAFSTRFVRLNGILFTRTSLETFGEIFSLVISNLYDLLSSGPEEELNFGQDAAENGLVIVRLVTILIFSVHNVNRESEGQSYLEILQRTVLLQNAFSAAFEFAGHLLKRCIELNDVASSFLLPAILVFMEWLACHPDFASRIDIEEKEAASMSFFWNQCISFMNKLMHSGLGCIDSDEDTTCFSDMSHYDEGETDNRLALWEDLELRGFSPLVPAQLILDFSRNLSLGNEGSNKERKCRVQRILAAGKALVHVVTIDQQGLYYDSHLKKFVIGTKSAAYVDHLHTAFLDASEANGIKQTSPVRKNGMSQSKKENLKVQPSKIQISMEGEEDDEEIVFQPTVAEKYPSVSKSIAYESINPLQNYSEGDLTSYGSKLSAALDNLNLASAVNTSSYVHATAPSISQPPPENVSLSTSKWFMEKESFFTDGLRNINISENGWFANPILQESSNGLHHTASLPFLSAAANHNPGSALPRQKNVPEAVIPSKLDSVVPSGGNSDGLAMKFSAPLLATSRKNPVSRPVRQSGPPPGFSNSHAKRLDDSISKSVVNGQHPQTDDYRWLDGYQMPLINDIRVNDSMNHIAHPQFTTSNSNAFSGTLSFPFPGKQIPMMQTEVINAKKRHDFQLSEQLKLYSKQQFPQPNQQSALLPEQYQAQSLWSNCYFV